MNGADTAWIIVATALVLFMTLPGLALFYGGLVRSRNVLSVLMQCIAIACLMSVLWLVIGYSIAFGDGGSANAYWGGLGKMFLTGIGPDTLSGTIPEVLFFGFQMTFAIITPALIVGAYVERIGFGFVMLFSALWMLLCYAPVAHWIWGGGMLADGGIFGETGVKDFAGGIVVHETAGLAALAPPASAAQSAKTLRGSYRSAHPAKPKTMAPTPKPTWVAVDSHASCAVPSPASADISDNTAALENHTDSTAIWLRIKTAIEADREVMAFNKKKGGASRRRPIWLFDGRPGVYPAPRFVRTRDRRRAHHGRSGPGPQLQRLHPLAAA